jgi:hypothetical protein
MVSRLVFVSTSLAVSAFPPQENDMTADKAVSNPMAKVACPECGKKLADKNGVYLHLKAKHGGKGSGAFKHQYEPDDESFADRAVQAEIDRACGVPNPDIDWLLR